MATHASLSQASVAVDTSELKLLAKVLRDSQPALKKELYKELRVAGAIVREEAVFRSLWSSRISGSIKVTGSGLHVKVVAQGSIAPEAAPLEHGGIEGPFRHPVFGDRDVWVNQQAHPFLAPALAARIDQVVRLVETAVEDALVSAGFER